MLKINLSIKDTQHNRKLKDELCSLLNDNIEEKIELLLKMFKICDNNNKYDLNINNETLILYRDMDIWSSNIINFLDQTYKDDIKISTELCKPNLIKLLLNFPVDKSIILLELRPINKKSYVDKFIKNSILMKNDINAALYIGFENGPIPEKGSMFIDNDYGILLGFLGNITSNYHKMKTMIMILRYIYSNKADNEILSNIDENINKLCDYEMKIDKLKLFNNVFAKNVILQNEELYYLKKKLKDEENNFSNYLKYNESKMMKTFESNHTKSNGAKKVRIKIKKNRYPITYENRDTNECKNENIKCAKMNIFLVAIFLMVCLFGLSI
jgi:hypothetical protein